MGRKSGNRRSRSRAAREARAGGGGGGEEPKKKESLPATQGAIRPGFEYDDSGVPAGGGEYGPSTAAVRLSNGLTQRDVDTQTKAIFGRSLSNQELASMVGAPPNATVTVQTNRYGGGLNVSMSSPMLEASRTITKQADGTIMMHNNIFRVGEAYQKKGLGTAVLGRQVEQASKLGVDRIETSAARSDGRGGYNGYATWAREGYDAPIPSGVMRGAPQSLSSARNVSDLMRTKAGQEWWKSKGEWTEMTFNLKPGSVSMATHNAYKAERRARVR